MIVEAATSSPAGIVTAFASVLTAFGGLLLSVAYVIPAFRTVRKTKIAVDEVHTIVNQQRTDAQRYQIALVSALKAAGIDVPIDQSLPIVEDL